MPGEDEATRICAARHASDPRPFPARLENLVERLGAHDADRGRHADDILNERYPGRVRRQRLDESPGRDLDLEPADALPDLVDEVHLEQREAVG